MRHLLQTEVRAWRDDESWLPADQTFILVLPDLSKQVRQMNHHAIASTRHQTTNLRSSASRHPLANVYHQQLLLLLLLHPFNGLFSRTTWVSQYQKGKTSLDLNKARGLWDAVTTAGPYANNLHLALISVYSFWRPTNSIKALKARLNEYKHYYLIYTHTTV